MENASLLSVATYNCQFFHSAIINGSWRIIKNLLSYGADANVKSTAGFTPLHIAVIHNQRRIAQLLITMGADVNCLDFGEKLPIWYAVENANVKITKLLLANGAFVNGDPKLLNIAVKENCIRLVHLLLKNGADVNGSDEYGETALLNASSFGFDEMIHVLVAAGASLNAASTGFGYTPLHEATERGHYKTVEVLLKLGAKVDALSTGAITALQIAAEHGNPRIVATLLKFGANVNLMDNEGNTALHFAATGAHVNIIPMLLSHGADINLTTMHDETPVQCAITGLMSCNFFHDDSTSFHFRSGCLCGSAVKIFIRHVVKLKHIKSYVANQNWHAIGRCNSVKSYYLKCEQEWKEMRRFKFPASFINFCDILLKNVNSLAVLMRNDYIRLVVRSKGYKCCFPIYSSELEYKIQLGVERMRLMKKSRIIFSDLPRIPDLCVDKILGYIGTDDLKVLVAELVGVGRAK